MRTFLIIPVFSIIFIWLTGCSVYKVDIQQGNTLDQEQIDQVKLGMNSQQIKYVLGSPMLTDPLHPNRWDYVYTFKPGGGKLFKQHYTLFFEQDKLVRIENKLVNPGGKGPKTDAPANDS
ncbi:MAG: outer membrane protein assembly factor BamE [Gammaproteobacteria bacterium]|nr:outer membrane protein assembly factor BamE [Gammaproteobacteria bacterium]